MNLLKVNQWPLFTFSTVVALLTLVQVALHPLDMHWWLIFAVCLGGVALYLPIPGTARVRKSFTVERPITVVYSFLSLPDNLRIWNPRAGIAQPAKIPVEVGQEWTYSPGRWLFRKAPSSLRHTFSKVNPPSEIEITASGRGFRAVYAYILRDLGERTGVTLNVTMTGMPAAVAWLTSVVSSVYPSRDISRLKRALELGGSTTEPSPSP